ncbi:MAG: 50S ribosomal protein L3 [bacterium]
MSFIVGKKAGMTQRHLPDGIVVPVTVVKVEPNAVRKMNTIERDGYLSLQISAGSKRKINKPTAKQLGVDRADIIKEVRVEKLPDVNLGQIVDLNSFQVGDLVKVTGVSKGKGFQGVVKRHGFHGHPTSHGHKDQERMPGSIGAGGVQHVFKGLRMAGHMGNEQSTARNLEVVEVNAEKNELSLKGAVPGANNSWVVVQGTREPLFVALSAAPQEQPVETEKPEVSVTENKPA